jgi:hypothetical protein
VIGALVALVLNLLHPRVDEYDRYSEAVLAEVARSGSWVILHLGLLVATILITLGLVVVGRSIRGERGEAAGRLAMATAVLGGAVGTLILGYDGIAMKRVADVAAAGGADAQPAAVVAAEIGWGLFMTLNIVALGLVPLVFGAALLVGEGYARWLGPAGLLLGLASVVLGVWGSTADPTSGWILAYTIVSGLTIVWLFGLGMALLRLRPAPDRPPAERAARAAA